MNIGFENRGIQVTTVRLLESSKEDLRFVYMGLSDFRLEGGRCIGPGFTIASPSADPDGTDYNDYKNLLIGYGVPEIYIKRGPGLKMSCGDPLDTSWSIFFDTRDRIDDVINIVYGFLNDARYNINDDRIGNNNDEKEKLRHIPERAFI